MGDLDHDRFQILCKFAESTWANYDVAYLTWGAVKVS